MLLHPKVAFAAPFAGVVPPLTVLSYSGVCSSESLLLVLWLTSCPHNHCPAQVTVHERRHTGVQPYGCPVCGRRFKVSGALLDHTRRLHRGLKLDVAACSSVLVKSE